MKIKLQIFLLVNFYDSTLMEFWSKIKYRIHLFSDYLWWLDIYHTTENIWVKILKKIKEFTVWQNIISQERSSFNNLFSSLSNISSLSNSYKGNLVWQRGEGGQIISKFLCRHFWTALNQGSMSWCIITNYSTLLLHSKRFNSWN